MSLEQLSAIVILIGVYTPQAMVLAHHDGATHRLPNRNVALLTLTVASALAITALALPELRQRALDGAVLALVLGAFAILFALLAPSALGMGDAKSMPVVVLISAVLGAEVLIAGAVAAMALSALAGIALLLRGRDRRARVPVGPMLLAVPHLGVLGAPLVQRALGIA